jgi:hypothetical protein
MLYQISRRITLRSGIWAKLERRALKKHKSERSKRKKIRDQKKCEYDWSAYEPFHRPLPRQ